MNATANLADAAFAAADAILADPAADGRLAYDVTGRRDGTLHVAPHTGTPGRGPADVVVYFCGDSYDAIILGEEVSGAIHTLRAVIARRLARYAARIPANS